MTTDPTPDYCPACLSAPGVHAEACPLRPDDSYLLPVWSGGFVSGATLALSGLAPVLGLTQDECRPMALAMMQEFAVKRGLHDPQARQQLTQAIRDAITVEKIADEL